MRLLKALLVVLLAGCTSQAPHDSLKDLSGLMPDLQFDMTDDTGRPVRAADFHGRVVLLFFGYTHCPDVCPSTLARLAQALAATRDRGASERVLFVSVDPQRDSVVRLHEYVRAFGPGIVGLRGTAAALERLARRYRVGYSREKPDADGNYAMSHSSGVFVFDPAGRARLLLLPKDDPASIAAALDRMDGQTRG